MIIRSVPRITSLALLPLGLAACGGGVTGTTEGETLGIAPPSTGCLEAGCTYGSNSTKLVGVGVVETRNLSLDVTNRQLSFANVDIDVASKTLTLSNSAVSIVLSEPSADLTDPNLTVVGVSLGGDVGGSYYLSPDSDYEFVKVILTQLFYTYGEDTYFMDTYVGLVTDASAVPVAGVATYTGSASGGVDWGGDLPEILLGSAELTADFAAGTVDLTADFNMVTDGTDYVTVNGMQIDGNTFSGGELTIYTYDAIPAESNLTVSDALGSGVTHSSTGVFFGVDESLALEGGGTTLGPDEVAGAVIATGSNGQLYFTYVAD